jgi:plasmid stabilization system protein ParE
MRLIWLPVAVSDLNAVFDFYIQKNYNAAVVIYNNIVNEADILMKYPNIGMIEPLLDDLPYIFRSLVTKSGIYKIIYYIWEDTIYISHIWDCRRNPETIRKH